MQNGIALFSCFFPVYSKESNPVKPPQRDEEPPYLHHSTNNSHILVDPECETIPLVVEDDEDLADLEKLTKSTEGSEEIAPIVCDEALVCEAHQNDFGRLLDKAVLTKEVRLEVSSKGGV